MQTKILNFKKTNHCLLRQWERSISDRMLYIALRSLNGHKYHNTLVCAEGAQLKRYLEGHNPDLDLIIKLDGNVIVTLFLIAHQEVRTYLNKSNKHFKIIYV